jgi:hypothetical protein
MMAGGERRKAKRAMGFAGRGAIQSLGLTAIAAAQQLVPQW